MLISDLLRYKGSAVTTLPSSATVGELLAKLAEHNIGALVVSDDGRTIAGIVSERDVVRRLHERGAALLEATVGSIMTTEVRTCAPGDNLDTVRRTMTERRFRHLPVVSGGRMVGIISIGDVVKSAISELEAEREYLVGYIQS
ncbi:CBS domain-containing protein [Rhizohabitans arisaemae]|uniref:CBS domain-containing protein n=1 Tax=Rhizohabitans arisaemae TaxID=2720610 RepID=UPI0024B18D8B|nr:CBS domain-containing protein [Rhizohabitans arisaemae]